MKAGKYLSALSAFLMVGVMMVFSGTVLAATYPNCTLAASDWYSHQNEWVTTAFPLQIGTHTYSATQVHNILGENLATVHNPNIVSLGMAIIAAKLSIAQGAVAPAAVSQALVDANALVGNVNLNGGGGQDLTAAQVASLLATLNDFNSGVTGPGTCTLVTVTATVVLDPTTTGSTAPTLALTCVPGVRAISGTPTDTWTVIDGSTCKLETNGDGVEASGFYFDTVTFASAVLIDSTGTFTVNGNASITATITVMAGSAPATFATISGAVAFTPAISGGTPPTLALVCDAPAVPTPLPAGGWEIDEGATCTLGLDMTGATAPAGYSFDAVTFGPAGTVDPVTGEFTVPVGGITNLSASIALLKNNSTPVSTPTLDPKALLMLALFMLLLGGIVIGRAKYSQKQ
ncbi:MAG: hypothetical protein FWF41_05865 [Betaproteobacteria bacterium]|nr:hypothetical protein [Betaproteobacteria bacterium]